MKKLKKSSLEELAQKMPVVNEKESAECVGGDFYFDKNGNYLGVTQSGLNIYYTNSNDFNNYYQSNPNYLASISHIPSQDLLTSGINFQGGKKIARYFLGNSVNGEIIYWSGVDINYPSQNYQGTSAYNGSDLFINVYSTSIDSVPNLFSAYNHALTSGYFPGARFTT